MNLPKIREEFPYRKVGKRAIGEEDSRAMTTCASHAGGYGEETAGIRCIAKGHSISKTFAAINQTFVFTNRTFVFENKTFAYRMPPVRWMYTC